MLQNIRLQRNGRQIPKSDDHMNDCFEVNKPGKPTIFQFFSDVDFLAAREEALKLSQRFSSVLAERRVLCPT